MTWMEHICTFLFPTLLYTADPFQQVELRLMECFIKSNVTPSSASLGEVE